MGDGVAHHGLAAEDKVVADEPAGEGDADCADEGEEVEGDVLVELVGDHD